MTHAPSSMLERYRLAETLALPALLAGMRNRTIEPMWHEDGTFIYRRETGPETHEFMRVLPEEVAREPAFDHERMAVTLSQLLGREVEARRLPVKYCRQSRRGVRLTLTDGQQIDVDEAYRTEAVAVRSNILASPAGGRELFCRDHNLWFRDHSSGAEWPLTTNGEAGFGWGQGPEVNYVHIPLKRAKRALPPMLTLFSPSGRFVLALRLDERGYVSFPFYEGLPENGAAPVVHVIRTHMPDTKENRRPSASHEMKVFDLERGSVHPVTLTEDEFLFLAKLNLAGIAWSLDERSFWLHTGAGRLLEIAWEDGRIHQVYADPDPHWENNTFLYHQPLVRVLPASDEFIWFSMEDGWGHLYLHDLKTGQRKNRITQGPIVVHDLQRIDEARREILFIAGCGVDGHHPLWRKLYRAGLEGGAQRLLTPEPVDHEMPLSVIEYFRRIFHRDEPTLTAISPRGDFFIDHMSTVSAPPRIVLRDRDGAIVMELEQTDITGLLEMGYPIPQSFHVRSEDGRADLWGAMSLPPNPIDARAIPVVEVIYAGYQVTWVPTCFLGPEMNAASFSAAAMFNALGFAVVCVDGRGTPGRDCEFRRWTVGHGASKRGLEDHVWAIRSLKSRYPALDLERVGIAGRSYGGYHSARAMLLFPEFYKVGVSNAGVHHPPLSQYGQWRWHLGKDYDACAPELLDWSNVPLASQLQGRLLIMMGNLDENVSINHSFALIQELIRCGKRFDLKLWPDTNHYGTTPYILMAYWDYFVEHLLEKPVPQEYVPAGADRQAR